MNKGFTLVELLAVLFILSVITILTVPNVIETNKKTKQTEQKEFETTIENAAEIYVETHQNNEEILNLKNPPHQAICISTKKLVDLGLISGYLRNPKDGKTLNDVRRSVSVTNVTESGNSEVRYTYKQGENCQ